MKFLCKKWKMWLSKFRFPKKSTFLSEYLIELHIILMAIHFEKNLKYHYFWNLSRTFSLSRIVTVPGFNKQKRESFKILFSKSILSLHLPAKPKQIRDSKQPYSRGTWKRNKYEYFKYPFSRRQDGREGQFQNTWNAFAAMTH